MANANGWGDGASNNNIGWGKGADNAIGWGSVYSVSSAGATDIIGTPAVDPDAQAFITAASITDPTQQSAINQLVVDLKGYNIWTKMKALYPFVGGTAAQHKWNLKDPRDLDAAFRLVFSGGWTHSANGALPNGTNGYADTFFKPSNSTYTNFNFGFYLRTNSTGVYAEFGFADVAGYAVYDYPNLDGNGYVKYGGADNSYTGGDTRGMYSYNQNSNQLKRFKNGSLTNTFSNTPTNISGTTLNYFVAARNVFGTAGQFSNRQRAFQYIADGLTDTENTNLYTAIQAFQTTLGRSIGTQTVSDADAQAFVTNAGIVDQVEANAVNNLVIGLKADGLWTKMKACYPMVGGSSSTMKYNLKNPLDTDAAFRLVFNGGWTFSSNGATPNGTNAYADTKLNPSVSLSQNSTSYSAYSRTNTDVLGTALATTAGTGFSGENSLFIKFGSQTYIRVNTSTPNVPSNTDGRGYFIANRNSSTQQNLMTRGTRADFSNNSQAPHNANFLLGGFAPYYDNKEYAFAHIGDGLTNTDLTNLNSRVTTFQTELNRNV